MAEKFGGLTSLTSMSGNAWPAYHGEAGEIQVFGRRDLRPAAFAAALAGRVDLFAEIRGPDDVAADPHATEQARDYRPFGRRGDAQAVQPRALDPLRRGEGRDDPVIDHRSDGGADEAADGRTRKAEDGTAKCAANRGANGAENKGCHV